MYKIILSATLALFLATGLAKSTDEIYGNARLLNQEDDGFRGIWYMISAPDSEYKLKYGGGLGTYPANHYPFSVYVAEVNKTFFCYGVPMKQTAPYIIRSLTSITPPGW